MERPNWLLWSILTLAACWLDWLWPRADAGQIMLAIAPALVLAGGTILGAGIGAASAAADRAEQEKQIRLAIKDLEAIGIPAVEAQQLVLDEFRSAGQLSPELEQVFALGPSAYESITTDPTYREASLEALSKLGEISDSGGLTLSDRAAYERLQADVNEQARGREGAILQDLAGRGQLGTGMELLSRLQTSQDAAQRLNEASLGQAGQAQQRALDALIQRGELGGKLRGQEFDERARIAAARDKIAEWNAMNTQSVRERNVGRGNEAQRYNLEGSQRIMDANTQLRNAQQQYNKGLLQQQFENQLAVGQAKAGARTGAGQQYGQRAQQTAGNWARIGQGAGMLGGELARETASGSRTLQPYTMNGGTRWTGEDEWRKPYA